MRGIAGFFNCKNSAEKTINALHTLKNRGSDGCGIAFGKKVFFAKTPAKLKAGKTKNAVGHLLHSIMGDVKQPLKGKGILAADCEIYNRKELCGKHGLKAGNDAELLLRLIEKKEKIVDALKELDGVWAFAYWRGNKVILARDLLGVKPIWYSTGKGLCFASERKALEKAGCRNAIELNPRRLMLFDLKKNRAKFIRRKFFDLKGKKKGLGFQETKKELLESMEQAVRKRIPQKRFGLLFSGGVDSLFLAALLKGMNLQFKCFFAYAEGLGRAKDLAFAQRAAKELGLELETIGIKIDGVEKALAEIVPLIESASPVKVGVGLPLYFACRAAKKCGVKVVFSGLGADELFCGYARFRESNNVVLDSRKLLLRMHENDLYRDDVITMDSSIGLRLPFLDRDVMEKALSMPHEFKISAERNKIIVRELAKELGIPHELAERGKKAAQYGSNFDKAIEKLAKKSGAKGKEAYLRKFAEKKNMKVAALFSGGKDSCLALWIMRKRNYEVACLVSLLPENPDSFMYHQPDEKVLKMQAEALELPLITERTNGEKEKELRELESALKKAKKRFNIHGVVSGALYSNYQRKRIQRICRRLGLRLFSPLWHMEQGAELKELESEGFVFVMTKIAAAGLGKEWLGKEMGKKEIVELEWLGRKMRLNVAGEGGEFESLVIDGPNFRKKIKIGKAEKIMENEFTGRLKIMKAGLEEK